MAYETEKTRFLSLLTAATGINRTLDAKLGAEADERAFEAYQQVGTNGTMQIVHPPQIERESRLGPEWAGKGVVELATWNYLWRDPIQAAVNGLMGSPTHRNILLDTRFQHWGAGIYTWKGDGESEIARRWYFIIWMSVYVPVPAPEPTTGGPTALPAVRNFTAGCGTFQINPNVNLRKEANLDSSTIIRATANGSTEKINVIGTTEGVSWNGSNRWAVGWMAHPAFPAGVWTYVHSTLIKKV